jgi:2-polyprenyl-6-methoxyphenol hydroxylase-like FAD-dependent oxidoreductase
MEDIVIIGTGPSGLFAAGELARHGVRARLLEHARQPYHQSRATAVQPTLLETLAWAGVAEAFLRTGIHVARTRFYGPGLNELGSSGFELADCLHPFQCSLPQWRTDALLTAHLEGGYEAKGIICSAARPPG